MDEKFHMFLETVDERFRSFVSQINEYLTENGCKCDVKLQKRGYIASYVLNGSKRTLATFVSRKTGMKLRIYPEHIQEYQSFLDTLPESKKHPSANGLSIPMTVIRNVLWGIPLYWTVSSIRNAVIWRFSLR